MYELVYRLCIRRMYEPMCRLGVHREWKNLCADLVYTGNEGTYIQTQWTQRMKELVFRLGLHREWMNLRANSVNTEKVRSCVQTDCMQRINKLVCSILSICRELWTCVHTQWTQRKYKVVRRLITYRAWMNFCADSVYTERYMGFPRADDNLSGYQVSWLERIAGKVIIIIIIIRRRNIDEHLCSLFQINSDHHCTGIFETFHWWITDTLPPHWDLVNAPKYTWVRWYTWLCWVSWYTWLCTQVM